MNRKQKKHKEQITNLRYYARAVIEIMEYVLILMLIYIHFIKGIQSDLIIYALFFVNIAKLLFGVIDLKEKHANIIENIIKIVADIILPLLIILMVVFAVFLK